MIARWLADRHEAELRRVLAAAGYAPNAEMIADYQAQYDGPPMTFSDYGPYAWGCLALVVAAPIIVIGFALFIAWPLL